MQLDPRETSVLISIGRRAVTGYYKKNPVLSNVAKRILSTLGPQATRIACLLYNQHVESPTDEELIHYHLIQGLPVPKTLRTNPSSNKPAIKSIETPKCNKGDNVFKLESSLT
jgi:hypothetical protein